MGTFFPTSIHHVLWQFAVVTSYEACASCYITIAVVQSTGSSNVGVGPTRSRTTISTVVLELASPFEFARVATHLYHAPQSRHHWHGALLQAFFWVRCRVQSPRFLPALRRERDSCRSHVTLPQDGKEKVESPRA